MTFLAGVYLGVLIGFALFCVLTANGRDDA